MEALSFELVDIEVSFLDKEILKIDRLAIHQFDRIGIVGKNGAGKSTLLKLLAGKIKPAKGKINTHVEAGYFEQIEAPKDMRADPALLGKLNVPKDSEQLSGGEQTKKKLSQLFTDYHEALLIDEPTTHLDQVGIQFLLDQLRYYYGALVLVSHDRAVLNELVEIIWEIDDGAVKVYSGNYDEYLEQKKLEQERQQEAHEQYIKEKNRLEKAAQEKMQQAKNITQAERSTRRQEKPNRMFESKSKDTSQKAIQRAAKAIEKRQERLVESKAVKIEQPIVFPQAKSLKLHNKVPIMANDAVIKIEDKVLLDKVSFQFPLEKKIALIGDNGSGKTTLFNYIAEKSEVFTFSPKAEIGYFKQMSYQFTSEQTVLEFIQESSDYNEGFIRSILHAMQFVGTDIRKKVNTLSGGEAVRLQLCRLFLGRYNILLLDEPTNFLDIYAIDALKEFVLGYEGTVLFITHDQSFIEDVADVVYEIEGQNIVRK